MLVREPHVGLDELDVGAELRRAIAGSGQHRRRVVDARDVVAAHRETDRDPPVAARQIGDPGGVRRAVLRDTASMPSTSSAVRSGAVREDQRSRYVASKNSRHQSDTHESVA